MTSFFFEITIGGQKGLVSYRTDQEPHQLAVYSWTKHSLRPSGDKLKPEAGPLKILAAPLSPCRIKLR